MYPPDARVPGRRASSPGMGGFPNMKSLSAILAAESLATLDALSAWWGAERPRSDDDETRLRLERAMRDTIAARFVWERLDTAERRVLFAVVGASPRNWCPLEQPVGRAHLGPGPAAGAPPRPEGHPPALART